ncbi:MAG: class I tRNA ligase family protein [Candidatus Liptonbacteria bacterium]|nr:class I tRNA ligase family protein [Candidatus Liptonbacteria bacterium]
MSGKFYITTAIDYVNGPPHIGHAIQKVWADVIARYGRLSGKEVFFLTGTDEHGLNIARAAERQKKTPQELADDNAAKFRGLREALNLSWDDFIRTTDKKRHWPGVLLMWKNLVAAGDIYRKQYRGLYCAGHEAFITEKDIVDGKCVLHGKPPEAIDEENYFFRLSKYSKEIGDKIRSNELAIVPESRKNEILSLIEREGLEDVSFSRSRGQLEWGIPVPGDESQTMYVWCDALTNYISAIGYGRNEDWKKWWPADLHVLGKDNLRFHAAIWPGMLLSAGLPLPKKLFVHGFVTANGQKMSKTIGNIIDPYAIVKKYGTDAVRYYFLREISSHEDGDFSEKKLEALYNADLANGIGNFAARVLTLAESDANLRIYANTANKVPDDIEKKLQETKKTVAEKIEEFKFHEALASIWGLISFGDEYVNKSEPWKIADPKIRTQTVFDLIVLLDNIAALLAPFLPGSAEKITKSIVWEGNSFTIKKGEVLFPRLSR